MIQVLPVIMAGGSGTRLWPLSRAGYPKQFLVLSGNESLFQLAARRLAALAGPGVELAAPCIVGNDEHRFLVLDQLREIKQEPTSVVLEPQGPNGVWPKRLRTENGGGWVSVSLDELEKDPAPYLVRFEKGKMTRLAQIKLPRDHR